jgi:hypothetical protein
VRHEVDHDRMLEWADRLDVASGDNEVCGRYGFVQAA